MMRAPFALALLFLAAGCGGNEDPGTAAAEAQDAPPPADRAAAYTAYWHQGKAEITSYRLEQARYGEIHSGHAVTIFVTEDFSRSKHVKLDRPGQAGVDRAPVLKLNATRNFLTGIYPYSMMTSVFTSAEGPAFPTFKVTTTSQEWCGHTFTQLNRTGAGYRVRAFSYFESEGDQNLELDAAVLEDELWTRIRLDPETLPVGEVLMIPGTIYQRLRHVPWGVHRANATREPDPGQAGLVRYRVDYPELGRTLTIHYRNSFPYEIESWEETGPSGFGAGAPQLTTRAVRMERILSAYWGEHDVEDVKLRRQLGL